MVGPGLSAPTTWAPWRVLVSGVGTHESLCHAPHPAAAVHGLAAAEEQDRSPSNEREDCRQGSGCDRP